jgi:putative two-component system response regulator
MMGNRRANILIVEDEVGSRDSLRMILRPFNNVYSAETGQKALEILAEREFDVVTLDLKLPGIQGVDLMREIKRQQPNVETVIITGYGSLKSAIDGIRYGAAGYLLKPFNVVELLDVMNKAMEKKRRLDALRNFLSNLAMIEKPVQDQGVSHLQFVRVLANTLDSKDRFTYHHCVRVNIYANLIADQLNVPAAKRTDLELGAFLHDIGKIGVETKIIFKPEKLSEQETEMLKKHTEIGADIIEPLQLSPHVVSMIRHHHERYDGKGYPDGLKGEQIPQLTRIISLAESMDAMVADRPYRKALSLNEVVSELKRCSGTQWDPVLVDALLETIAEKGEEILPVAIDPKGTVAAT